MYKIGVLGAREAVLPFLSAGLCVYEADSASVAASQLKAAVSDGCAIIFVTPDIAKAIPEAIDKYAFAPTPAVIPLPEEGGGYGMAILTRAVERAVGADILSQN